MANYPYNVLAVPFNRQFRLDLNENFVNIETDMRELLGKINGNDSLVRSLVTQKEQDAITRENQMKVTITQKETESKQRDDALTARINNLVGQTGSSNTEIVDARLGVDGTAHPILKNRLDKMENQQVESARQTQVLQSGLSILNADVAAPVDFEIQGRTLVNLLGQDGNFEKDSNNDGVADGWVKSSQGAYTLEAVNAKYSMKAQRISAVAGDTIGTARRLDKNGIKVSASKYYLLIAEVQYDGVSAAYIRADFDGSNTILSATSTNKAVHIVKFSPASDVDAIVRLYNGSTLGTAGWVQFDGVRLYEVTAEEYAKIGVEWNDEEVTRRYPYVDDMKHLQNPYVLAEGENLVPSFTEWSLHANARVVNPYELELNATAINQSSFIDITVKKANQYVFSGDGIYTIRELNNGMVGASLLFANNTPFSPNSDQIRVYVTNTATGTFSFKNPILTLGKSIKPFVPRNLSYLFAPLKLGAIGTSKDLLFKQAGVWKRRKAIEKDVVLDGSFSFSLFADMTGAKSVMVPNLAGMITASDRFIITKHNGKKLKSGTTSDIVAEDQAGIGNVNTVISISDLDTGWFEGWSSGSTLNTDFIKAYFNGWKYTGTEDKATQTWVSVVDGSAAPTQSLDYVKANKATNYTPYKLSYVLATPAVETVNVEGDIAADGLTQIELSSGIIVREKANPTLHSGYYWINGAASVFNSIQELKNRLTKFISIHKNNTDITSQWTIENSPYANGLQRAKQPQENFDASADYYVTYLMMDKHLFTNNPIDVKAMYAKNIRSAHDDLAVSVSDLKTISTINVQAIAELYKRVKAMGG